MGGDLALAAFVKPSPTTAEQLSLLLSRGLRVGDPITAASALRHIGYYRLSGYARSFQVLGSGLNRHRFVAGTTFQDIIDRNVLDRNLRLLALDAIERIEIALRAARSGQVAVEHGSHWYMRPELLLPEFRHQDFLASIQRQIGHTTQDQRRQPHIEHYYEVYGSPDMPPCWMVFESASFAAASLAFKYVAKPSLLSLLTGLNLPHSIASSWLHSLNYVRNICAHHARLWNVDFRIKPIAARSYRSDLMPNGRACAQFVVMQVMLSQIAPDNDWAAKSYEVRGNHVRQCLDRWGSCLLGS